jgi:serine/threonine protein kinase
MVGTLDIIEEIGRGSANTRVYLAKYNEFIVAVKKLPIESRNINAEGLVQFLREAEIGQTVEHDNIIKFIGQEDFDGHPHLIMEYAENKDLHRYLVNPDHAINDTQKLRWASQISKAIQYLHSNGINHRDIRAANILLNKDLNAKVSDFGISKIRFDATGRSKKVVGQVGWFAPELFERNPKIGRKSDVWALGMTFWEIASRKEPFQGRTHAQIYTALAIQGEREVIPDGTPSKLRVAIEACWVRNPEERSYVDGIIGILEEGFEE